MSCNVLLIEWPVCRWDYYINNDFVVDNIIDDYIIDRWCEHYSVDYCDESNEYHFIQL
jgi:hypothetical protein